MLRMIVTSSISVLHDNDFVDSLFHVVIGNY